MPGLNIERVYSLHCICDALICCSVREFMAFTSDVLVERTRAGQRQTVKEQGQCHLVVTLITYPNFMVP